MAVSMIHQLNGILISARTLPNVDGKPITEVKMKTKRRGAEAAERSAEGV
jgi:hypothetical protein